MVGLIGVTADIFKFGVKQKWGRKNVRF